MINNPSTLKFLTSLAIGAATAYIYVRGVEVQNPTPAESANNKLNPNTIIGITAIAGAASFLILKRIA